MKISENGKKYIHQKEKKSLNLSEKKSRDIDLTANVDFRSLHALRDRLRYSIIADEYIF